MEMVPMGEPEPELLDEPEPELVLSPTKLSPRDLDPGGRMPDMEASYAAAFAGFRSASDIEDLDEIRVGR